MIVIVFVSEHCPLVTSNTYVPDAVTVIFPESSPFHSPSPSVDQEYESYGVSVSP